MQVLILPKGKKQSIPGALKEVIKEKRFYYEEVFLYGEVIS